MNGMTAWERWELAALDADPVPTVPEPEGAPAPQPAPLDPDEIERICAEARQEGHEAGYAAGQAIGRAEGYAAGQAAAAAEAQRLALAADHLDSALTRLDQQVADELLALATEIARQVIRGEISARPETVIKVVHEALTQLPHQHATIYLHPDDASLVRSHAGEALAHAGHRILEDINLKPGDCVLESGSSQIDASLATRWRRVVQSLGLSHAWDEKGPS